MSKALFINIDRNYRSVYLAETASIYRKTNSATKITLITSSGNDVLESTGVFENILYLDTDDFFAKSRNLSDDAFEREVRIILSPVIHTEWESIVNFSSNILGSMLIHFLKGKMILGPRISHQGDQLTHSSFSSFLLTRQEKKNNEYFHCSWLFKNILHVNGSYALNEKEQTDLSRKFDELKAKTGKKLILIDTSIKRSGKLTNLNFLIEFYQSIHEDENSLPVLYSSDSHNDSFLINKLTEMNNGEILLINSQGPGHLGIMKNVSLLVTDDIYLKSVADLAGTPSMLLFSGEKLPLSDFSTVEKSMLIATDVLELDLVGILKDLWKNILEGKKIGTISDIEVFQTHVLDGLPFLVPIRKDFGYWKSAQDFTGSYLEMRYLCRLEKIQIAALKIDQDIYRKIIIEERDNIKASMNKFLTVLKQEETKTSFEEKLLTLERENGILTLGIQYVRFKHSYEKDSKKVLEHVRSALKDVLEFLESEERA